MKHYIKKIAKVFFRPGTKRFAVARKIAQKLHIVARPINDAVYQEWTERTEPCLWSEQVELDYTPKISIVVPVFNPPEKYFWPMFFSVINQTYEKWELILVNASTNPKSKRATMNAGKTDPRVKVINIKNKGIGYNTNEGIKEATGDYIALLDHDDIIAPQALFEMVLAIQDKRKAGLIYSDEDKLSADGAERFDPHFKPDWSPQLLRQVNYINHFSMLRKDVVDSIEGYRQGFDGAQDYDLYLRAVDKNKEVVHVPKILYHWRTTETSTATNFGLKKGVLAAGSKAISSHLARNGLEGRVFPCKNQPGFYKIRYDVPQNTSVAIVVMPSISKTQDRKLLEYILETTSRDSIEVEIFATKPIEKIENPRVKITYIDEVDRIDILTKSHSLSKADAFIVIDGGVLPIKRTWAKDLVSLLLQDSAVGSVVPLIVNSDETTIFDGGLVAYDDYYINMFSGLAETQRTYFGNSDWVRNINSPSGRCFAVKNDFIPNLVNCYKDNKFSPRLFDNIVSNEGLQVCLFSFTKLIFAGDALLSHIDTTTTLSNPNLVAVKSEYKTSKTINIPEASNAKEK